MFCWNNYSPTAFTLWTRLKLQFIINDHTHRRCCCRDSVYQFINRWLHLDFRHATLGDIGIKYQNRIFIRLFSSVKMSSVELPIQISILWLMNNVTIRIFDYFSDYKVKNLHRWRDWNLYRNCITLTKTLLRYLTSATQDVQSASINDDHIVNDLLSAWLCSSTLLNFKHNLYPQRNFRSQYK